MTHVGFLGFLGTLGQRGRTQLPARHRTGRIGRAALPLLTGATVLSVAGPPATSYAASTSTTTSASTSTWIVADDNGTNSILAADAVLAVGGQVLEPLDAADAVAASLTSTQVFALAFQPGVVVTPDVPVSVQSTTSTGTRAPAAVFPQQTGATELWPKGNEGSGINVAVLDTGIDPLPDFGTRLLGGVDLSGEGNPLLDSYGHGTFVAGLVASSGTSSGGTYMGEAPGAGLVSVKVAGASGTTDLATVIAGVGWTIQHASLLHIRVLNMSLGFVPWESTVLNPLDQAVERAWNSGIVVVTSAGNAGPFSGTVLSPGDDPLVITVGALDDMGSTNPSDDVMTSFSSVGPTDPDGFYKPDLVTSGRSVVSLAAPGSTVYDQNPSAVVGTANFVGSGTSFSAAITSGAAALVLAAHPGDQPNDVKAALLGSASPGPVGNPFVDGHGALNVDAAAGVNYHLKQAYGDVLLSGSMDGNLQVKAGDLLSAGYTFTMPGPHPDANVELVGANVVLPLSCSSGGQVAGWVSVQLTGGPYDDPAGSNSWLPTGDQSSPTAFQGSAIAPDLCAGATMYDASATFWSEVVSTDSADPLQVKFHYEDASLISGPAPGWSATTSLTPVSATPMGATVAFSTPWAQSTWNPSNWRNLSVSSGSGSFGVTGLSWNGTAWNGSGWNGLSWNGSAWNGLSWNGLSWNGLSWNGLSWNGTSWNGAAWNSTAWNGAAWN